MKIALIGCTSKKKNYVCQAKELYSESMLFKNAYQYASNTCDKIYILSAKYGLIKDTDIIEPYNVTLNNQKAEFKKLWANKVISQFENEFDFSNDLEIICFAGNNYRKYLIPMIKMNHKNIKIELPLNHLGIGKQLKFLKEKNANIF